MPWREANNYSPWFGTRSNTLKIYNNAEPSYTQVDISIEVYFNGKAYVFELDDNDSTAIWENYDSNPVLVFNNDINNLHLVSYGTEEIEIDDIVLAMFAYVLCVVGCLLLAPFHQQEMTNSYEENDPKQQSKNIR